MEARLKDFTISYEDQGNGRPVLFIHGFPLCKDLWEPQLQALSENMRVIAPDLCGHGESEPATGPYTMERMAHHCHELIEYLQITQPVILCGLSMGGYVSLSYCKKYPREVAGLILTATKSDNDNEQGRLNRRNTISVAEQSGKDPIIASMLTKLLSPTTVENYPFLVKKVDGLMHNAVSVETIIKDQQGLIDRENMTPFLGMMNLPVCVMHGADDQIIPLSEAQVVHAALPFGRLVIIPKAGHLLNLEKAVIFNQEILSFLQNNYLL